MPVPMGIRPVLSKYRIEVREGSTGPSPLLPLLPLPPLPCLGPAVLSLPGPSLSIEGHKHKLHS